jgi:hypothetical protein
LSAGLGMLWYFGKLTLKFVLFNVQLQEIGLNVLNLFDSLLGSFMGLIL